MIFWYFLNHILLIVFIFYSYFIILILNKIIKISIIEDYEHNPNIILFNHAMDMRGALLVYSGNRVHSRGPRKQEWMAILLLT